jgi:hypothetical protein
MRRVCRTYNHVIVARIRYNVGLERKSQVSGIQVGRAGGDMLAILVVEQLWWWMVKKVEVQQVFGGRQRKCVGRSMSRRVWTCPQLESAPELVDAAVASMQGSR